MVPDGITSYPHQAILHYAVDSISASLHVHILLSLSLPYLYHFLVPFSGAWESLKYLRPPQEWSLEGYNWFMHYGAGNGMLLKDCRAQDWWSSHTNSLTRHRGTGLGVIYGSFLTWPA